MLEVTLSSESIDTIEDYIDRYQSYFLARFSDTGIWGESLIQKNYIDDASALRDNIYKHIRSSMSRDIIGYESGEDGMHTTATFLEKRIIFIEYREDREKMIRYIYSLQIVYR